MELSIIDRGETVGTASMESDGIYWKLVCRLTQKKNSPIRLYGLHLWQSEYLGIPDAAHFGCFCEIAYLLPCE